MNYAVNIHDILPKTRITKNRPADFCSVSLYRFKVFFEVEKRLTMPTRKSDII